MNHNSQVCRATDTRSKPSIYETGVNGNSVGLYESNHTSAQVYDSNTTEHKQSKLCSSPVCSSNTISHKFKDTDNFMLGKVDNGVLNR